MSCPKDEISLELEELRTARTRPQLRADTTEEVVALLTDTSDRSGV